jgi:glutamate formiminotransferase
MHFVLWETNYLIIIQITLNISRFEKHSYYKHFYSVKNAQFKLF